MTNDELDAYLESIGGLFNAWTTELKPIKNCGYFETQEGWNQLIKDCIEELIAAGWNKRVYQVKQKFGSLRFYTDSTQKVDDIIDKYEALSEKTCEFCGEPGEIEASKTGWLRACCQEHSSKGS